MKCVRLKNMQLLRHNLMSITAATLKCKTFVGRKYFHLKLVQLLTNMYNCT